MSTPTSEIRDCDRCHRPLRKVRWEMYGTRDDRAAAARKHGDQPAPGARGLVGVYGGICYYQERRDQADAGLRVYRRVVRVGGR